MQELDLNDQHGINQALVAEIVSLRAESLVLRKVCAMLIAETCRSAPDPLKRAEEMIALYESLQFDVIARTDLEQPGMQPMHQELESKEAEFFALARKWVKLVDLMQQAG